MTSLYLAILCLSVFGKGIVQDTAFDCNDLNSVNQSVNIYWAKNSIDELNTLRDTIEKLSKCLEDKRSDYKNDSSSYSIYLYNVKRLKSLLSYIAHPEDTNSNRSMSNKAKILSIALDVYPIELLNKKSVSTEDSWLTEVFGSMFVEYIGYVSSDSTIYINHRNLVMRLLKNKNLFVKATIFTSKDTATVWAENLAKIIEKSLNDTSITVDQAAQIFSKLIRDTVDVKTDTVLISLIVKKSFRDSTLKKILLALVTNNTIKYDDVLTYLSNTRQCPDSMSRYFQALTDNIVKSISQHNLKPEQLNAILSPLFITNGKPVEGVCYRDTLLFQFAQTMMTSAKDNIDFMVLVEKLLRENTNYSIIRKNIEKQNAMNIFVKMRLGRNEDSNPNDTLGAAFIKIGNCGKKLLPEENDFEDRLNTSIESKIKKDAFHIETLYEEREFKRMKDEILNRNKQDYPFVYFLKGCYLIDSVVSDGTAFIRVQLKMLDFKYGDVLGNIEESIEGYRPDDGTSLNTIVSQMIDNLFSDISENVLISISAGLKNQKKNDLFKPKEGINRVTVIPTPSFIKGRNFNELKADTIASIGFQVLSSTKYPGFDEILSTARYNIIKMLQYRYEGVFKVFDQTENDTGILVISCKALSADTISLDFKIAEKEYFTINIPFAINNSEITDPVFNRFFDDMCSYIDDHLMPIRTDIILPLRTINDLLPIWAFLPAFFPAGSSQLIFNKQFEENPVMTQKLRIPLGITLTVGQIFCMVAALRYDHLATNNSSRLSPDVINKKYIHFKYGFFGGAVGCGVVGSACFAIDNHTRSRIKMWRKNKLKKS